MQKKQKRFNTITGIVDTGLITLAVIIGGIFTTAFASGVGLSVGVAFRRTGLLFSYATVITRKISKTLIVKQKKYDAIELLSQSQLDSISNIISQAMRDEDISPTEFHKVLQEVEKHSKLEADIRDQAKTKVKEITKDQ